MLLYAIIPFAIWIPFYSSKRNHILVKWHIRGREKKNVLDGVTRFNTVHSAISLSDHGKKKKTNRTNEFKKNQFLRLRIYGADDNKETHDEKCVYCLLCHTKIYWQHVGFEMWLGTWYGKDASNSHPYHWMYPACVRPTMRARTHCAHGSQ